MDAITKRLCDEASIACNEILTIGMERKAMFEHLQSVERDREAHEKLRKAYNEVQAKWDAAFVKFCDAEGKLSEALKVQETFRTRIVKFCALDRSPR